MPPHSYLAALVSEMDHLRLERLLVELSWRIDHGQAATVHELFTEDGEMTIGPEPMVGRDAIREWGRVFDETQPMPGLRHAVTNCRFAAEGPDRATGTSILVSYLVTGDGAVQTIPFAVGEDQDSYVRTTDGWRISSRRWVSLFAR